MTTSAHRSTHTPNSNILYNGSTPSSKSNFPKTDDRGIGGRKALNDISNSRNPAMLLQMKKSTFTNVISVDKDSNIAKIKRSRVPEKKNIGGRKPLTDAPNSVDPSLPQVKKAALKLKRVSEGNAPTSILDERCLHNHEHCIKSQARVLDKDDFLSSVGLNTAGMSVQQSSCMSALKSCKKKLKSNLLIDLKMEPIVELPLDDHYSLSCLSPTCKPPRSPNPLGTVNLDDDDSAADLKLSHSPNQLL